MVTTLLFNSPTLHNRKSHRGKGPNVKPPAIPRHCRDNQLPRNLAIPVVGGGVDRNDRCIRNGLVTTNTSTKYSIHIHVCMLHILRGLGNHFYSEYEVMGHHTNVPTSSFCWCITEITWP